MITTVLIDIDNTLLDFNKCSRKAMIDACTAANIEFTENMVSTFHKINDTLWIKIESGSLTRDELHKVRWNMIFKEMGIDGDGIKFENDFVSGIYESHEPVDGARELLCYLSQKYTICAASNGSYDQQLHRLTKARMIEYFSHLFVSEKIGFAKPSNLFFEKCLEQLKNVDKSEIILIGDSLTADIEGGRNFGIKTCWYNHNVKPVNGKEADYTVNLLSEIKNIL